MEIFYFLFFHVKGSPKDNIVSGKAQSLNQNYFKIL